MILYTSLTSTYGFRIRMVLALKQVDAEIHPPPDGYRSVAFKKIFPTGLVPVLQDGDLILGEADVIAQYLDETYPTPPLLPGPPAERALARLLSRYHDLYLEPALKPSFPMLPQTVRDPGAIAAVEKELNDRLAEIELLARPAPFLAGSALSLADLAYPSTLAAAEVVAGALGMKLTPGPILTKWRAEIERHPIVGPMIAEYRAMLDKWLAARLAGQSPASIKA
jgi:glutathione S-transferase